MPASLWMPSIVIPGANFGDLVRIILKQNMDLQIFRAKISANMSKMIVEMPAHFQPSADWIVKMRSPKNPGTFTRTLPRNASRDRMVLLRHYLHLPSLLLPSPLLSNRNLPLQQSHTFLPQASLRPNHTFHLTTSLQLSQTFLPMTSPQRSHTFPLVTNLRQNHTFHRMQMFHQLMTMTRRRRRRLTGSGTWSFLVSLLQVHITSGRNATMDSTLCNIVADLVVGDMVWSVPAALGRVKCMAI
mmetsp:Transcript_72/g.177  ORF Transcript_72/g.177 Transcript_72/m.177 type:complete len:243 (-) Transcript_72:382-1110(-)